MAKFSDYIKEDNLKNISNESKTTNTAEKQNLENLINKYSSYSEDKLLSEFIKLTIEKKSRGELTKDELSNMYNVISPMLNSEQKKKLNELINMVENV